MSPYHRVVLALTALLILTLLLGWLYLTRFRPADRPLLRGGQWSVVTFGIGG